MIITAVLVVVATVLVVATRMPGPHPDQQTVQLEPHQPAAAPAAPSLPPSDHHGNETTSSRPAQRTHRCSVDCVCVCVCVCVCWWVGGPHEQEQQGVLLVRAWCGVGLGYFGLRSPDQNTPRTGVPHNEWSGRVVVASFATGWCWIEERLAVGSHFLLGSELEDPPTIFC